MPVGDCPRREVESTRRLGHVSPASKYAWSVSTSSPPRRSSASSGPSSCLDLRRRRAPGRTGAVARRRGAGGPGSSPAARAGRRAWVASTMSPYVVSQRRDAVNRLQPDHNPGLAGRRPARDLAPARGRRGRGGREPPEDAVEDGRDTRQTRPVGSGEDRDPAVERQHRRQADPGADTLGTWCGRSEQVADPAREHLELLVADARPLGDRIGLRTRRDRDEAVVPVGIQAVAGGDATQPGGRWRGGCGDDPEQLLERARRASASRATMRARSAAR